MRIHNLFKFLLFLGFMSTKALAQSKKVIAVSGAVEALRVAMIRADSAALSQLTLQVLSYGHFGGRVEDKVSYISTLCSGKSDFVTIDLSDQTVQVTGRTAIVRHTLSAKTNDSGQPGRVKLAVLTVWQKEKKAWKLLARQAVRI
jgi:ketosteroid isomerase-like protein